MTPTLQVFLPGWAEIADAERALNRLGSSGRTGVRAARVPSTGFHSWFSLLELPFYLAPKKNPDTVISFFTGDRTPHGNLDIILSPLPTHFSAASHPARAV